MAILGRRNNLTAVREAPPGLFLDGGPLGEILLPRRYIPAESGPGSTVEVFVYRDSEDRLVATTETPLGMVGDFVFLRAVSSKPGIGVFLDWGLSKDLLLPRREQTRPVRVGDSAVVHIGIDKKSDRIIGSMRLRRWLSPSAPAYEKEQPVNLLIAEETALGYNAVVENAHWGLIYRSGLSGPLRVGSTMPGFVRTVRPDGKIDLSLDRAGFSRILPLTERILEALGEAGGQLPLHDRSSPAEIRDAFGVSKKAFKQATGILYRKRLIRLEPEGIRRSG